MFDYTYTNLPSLMYSEIKLNPVIDPKLLLYNEELSIELGLDGDILKSEYGIESLVGNRKLLDEEVIAQAYCGHQFGFLNKLGDGRALLLAEFVTSYSERFDIHLKGSGKTPYSRGGDGRGTLSAMLREYIMSEAMHALGVPTTRSLSIVTTGESVQRDIIHDGAVLARIASSHIRIGTFEYAYRYGTKDDVKQLTDYTINRHYSHLNNSENKYRLFLKEVCKRQAKTLAKWQSIGFIHGVMNTDNILISGETIDYGPCAFMNIYDPKTIFSSIDVNGRYSLENQQYIGAWNLVVFAETILSLLGDFEYEITDFVEEAIDYYNECYDKELLILMCKKIGIHKPSSSDRVLIDELLHIMYENRLDYTNTFRQLTIDPKRLLRLNDFKNWHSKWKGRLKKDKKSQHDVKVLMQQNNSNIIPRNSLVEDALEDATRKGCYKKFEELLGVLKKPYNYQVDVDIYVSPVEDSNYQTHCNT